MSTLVIACVLLSASAHAQAYRFGRGREGEKVLTNASKTLETGVTSVRNLGASDFHDIAMRDLINPGLMTGPRAREEDRDPYLRSGWRA